MADEIDRANDLAEQGLQHALHAQRKRAAREWAGQGGQAGMCIDCEEPIDPARLAALPNVCRCVACQTVREKEYR